jgi:hypothetical protein
VYLPGLVIAKDEDMDKACRVRAFLPYIVAQRPGFAGTDSGDKLGDRLQTLLQGLGAHLVACKLPDLMSPAVMLHPLLPLLPHTEPASTLLNLYALKVLEYLLDLLPEAQLLILKLRRLLRVMTRQIKLLLKLLDALLVRTVFNHERHHPSLDLGKFFLKIFHVVISSMLLRASQSESRKACVSRIDPFIFGIISQHFFHVSPRLGIGYHLDEQVPFTDIAVL